MSFFKKLKNAIKGISSKSASQERELEEILIEADFGVELATKIAKELRTSDDLSRDLELKIEGILNPLVTDFEIDRSLQKPYVILMMGVNGSGKTTTIAKLAKLLQSQGLSVDIAACDTFRAAATEQLTIWAERLNCKIFKSDVPRDPASVAFEAAQNSTSDALIVDTAGRLHNNANLMNELLKIQNVLKKLNESAPHQTIITIDATIGQNSSTQVREFNKVCPISGLIITKMDGGSKGGTIVKIAEEFKIPILGVGIGESADDFKKFSVKEFLKDLMGE